MDSLASGRRIKCLIIVDDFSRECVDIESFNGKFRDESLNEQWFESLTQARHEIARWRCDYNEVRPHSAIGRIPPAHFAAAHRRQAGNVQHQPEIK